MGMLPLICKWRGSARTQAGEGVPTATPAVFWSAIAALREQARRTSQDGVHGGRMQDLLVKLIAGLVLISATGVSAGAQVLDARSARQEIKVRQKEERQALKLKEHYTLRMLKDQSLPKAERVRAKHEMQKERRDLILRQKDELQALRDRERSMKEAQSRL